MSIPKKESPQKVTAACSHKRTRYLTDTDNAVYPKVEELIKTYLQKLGHKSFRSIQKKIILDVVDGKNAFVRMKTGGGKSLCFQISILVRNAIQSYKSHDSVRKKAIGIVISPLLALQSDQVAKLQSCGINAKFWNSTLNSQQKDQLKYDIAIGKVDIIYTTPESLFSRRNGIADTLIKCRTVTTICIDEAHCIIMWGSSFRPSYFRLAESFKDFGNPPVIACTATVPSTMKKAIIKNLNLANNITEHVAPSNRANIELNIEELESGKAVFWRALILIQEMHQKYDLSKNTIIVFGGTIKTATEFYEDLKNKASLDIVPGLFHSRIKKDEKQGILNDFMNGSKNVIVATSGFGMGIDKANVRCIIHLAMAPNPEEWAQQIGRAGRDGKQAHAYLLTHPDDYFAECCVNKSCQYLLLRTKAFIFGNYDVNPNKRIGTPGQIYRAMYGIPEEFAKSSLEMTFEEMIQYLRFTNSMKILQRYGIIHQAGNSVWLLKKDTSDIDWKEVDDIDLKNMLSYKEMENMMHSKECIRKSLLAYFGQQYVKPKDDKFPCCSNCNKTMDVETQTNSDNRTIPTEE